jgi:hypothetical protein
MRTLPLIAILLAVAFTAATTAYVLNDRSWPQGIITVHAAFGSSPALIDGCADWSCSALASMGRWNTFLGNVQFNGVANSSVTPGDGNRRNEMFFAADAFGRPFGNNTLAVAMQWFRGSTMVEGDIVFNNARQTINFPGRQETLRFGIQLEDIYRADLGRAAVQTRVDAEGDVVWIQEYLRYRLNACTHDQSITRVEEQIAGRGVPATCR